jgi:hypothetical protein
MWATDNLSKLLLHAVSQMKCVLSSLGKEITIRRWLEDVQYKQKTAFIFPFKDLDKEKT